MHTEDHQSVSAYMHSLSMVPALVSCILVVDRQLQAGSIKLYSFQMVSEQRVEGYVPLIRPFTSRSV